jgi:hypothetical protein
MAAMESRFTAPVPELWQFYAKIMGNWQWGFEWIQALFLRGATQFFE